MVMGTVYRLPVTNCLMSLTQVKWHTNVTFIKKVFINTKRTATRTSEVKTRVGALKSFLMTYFKRVSFRNGMQQSCWSKYDLKLWHQSQKVQRCPLCGTILSKDYPTPLFTTS
jgi:hypothetical protein